MLASLGTPTLVFLYVVIGIVITAIISAFWFEPDEGGVIIVFIFAWPLVAVVMAIAFTGMLLEDIVEKLADIIRRLF